MDDKIKSGNNEMLKPSYFGDKSNSNYDSQILLSDEERIPIPWSNIANTTDSLSDVEVLVMQPEEDADQQFWGDNELDSTSLSDIDTCQHISMNNSIRNMSDLLIQCAQCDKTRMADTLATPPARKRKRTKRKSSSSPHNRVSLADLNPINIQSYDVNDFCPRSDVKSVSLTRISARELALQYNALLEDQLTNSSSSDSVLNSAYGCNTLKLAKKEEISFPQHHYSSCSSIDEEMEIIRKVVTLPGEKCPCCEQRPKNAIIVHGAIGHQCYCYQCAMKMWKTHANCPLCQRKIYKVVKHLST